MIDFPMISDSPCTASLRVKAIVDISRRDSYTQNTVITALKAGGTFLQQSLDLFVNEE